MTAVWAGVGAVALIVAVMTIALVRAAARGDRRRGGGR